MLSIGQYTWNYYEDADGPPKVSHHVGDIQNGKTVVCLVRTHLSKGLGFSRADRDTNIKRIAFVCALLTRNGVISIAAAISPYRETRAWARQEIGNFVEVYVKCPVEVCRQRDLKGLYKLADVGKIPDLTGVNDPYEEPESPELLLETDKQTIAECTDRILAKLEELGYLVLCPSEFDE